VPIVEAHNNLGVVLCDQGKGAAAEAAFRKALELQPDLAMAHNNLGNALRMQGKLREAEAAQRKAIEIKPDYVPAYDALGTTLRDQGKLRQAVAAYRKALDLQPDFPDRRQPVRQQCGAQRGKHLTLQRLDRGIHRQFRDPRQRRSERA
jgi:tetratricopeptide (TPR) repeat protein